MTHDVDSNISASLFQPHEPDKLNGWQDISTAPKHGTEVLGCYAYRHDENSMSAYGPWSMKWSSGRWAACWDGSHIWDSQWGTQELDIQPTHWQPMPILPSI